MWSIDQSRLCLPAPITVGCRVVSEELTCQRTYTLCLCQHSSVPGVNVPGNRKSTSLLGCLNEPGATDADVSWAIAVCSQLPVESLFDLQLRVSRAFHVPGQVVAGGFGGCGVGRRRFARACRDCRSAREIMHRQHRSIRNRCRTATPVHQQSRIM